MWHLNFTILAMSFLAAIYLIAADWSRHPRLFPAALYLNAGAFGASLQYAMWNW